MRLTKTFGDKKPKPLSETHAPLPYSVSLPNLTRDMLDLLHKNKSSEEFLTWIAKPGDYVASGMPIARFNLKTLPVKFFNVTISNPKLLTPLVFMPDNGILTEITAFKDLFSSNNLFSFRPLIPVEKTDRYEAAAPSEVLEVLEERSHPQRAYRNVFQALDVLKTGEDKSVTPLQVRRLIQRKHAEMMPIIVSASNTAQPLPPGNG